MQGRNHLDDVPAELKHGLQPTCRWHSIRACTLVALLAIGDDAARADFSGRLIGVLDGDTVDVLVELKPVRVRLAEFYAPGKAQPWGTRSRQAL